MIQNSMIKLFLLYATVILTLNGCVDSGSSSDEPTDKTIAFQLFTDSFFNNTYSISFSLSGNFSNGDKVDASIQSRSAGSKTFNSQSVNTIFTQIQATNKSTGAVVTNSGEEYYSTDKNNLMLIGDYSSIDQVTAIGTSLEVIPLSATIGDFGTIGSYSHSDGKSSTTTWSLEDGYNGKAILKISTIIRDSSGDLDTTSITSRTIDTGGNVSKYSVVVTYHQNSNLVMTLLSS